MKRKLKIAFQSLLIVFLVIGLLTSISILPIIQIIQSGEQQEKVVKDWTYMVYLDADNDLESNGIEDINEMEDGFADSSAGDVNVIVLIDRAHSGAKTYRISHDNDLNTINSATLTTGFPSEPNMGSKFTLKNFITYCFTNYPAEKYVLNLWDHGTGIFGICWDITSANDKLTFDEIDEAISEACVAAGETIDILALDACLMSMLEIGYEMQEYVDYIVASEETIPGDGYPYDTMINRICTTPTQSSGTYAYDMVDDYHNFYTMSQDTTLSAINITSPSNTNLINALNLFINESIRQIDLGYKSYFASALAATQKFSVTAFIDLFDFVQEIQARREDSDFQHICDILMNNISNIVLNSKQHNNPQAYGISIYFPEDPSTYDDWYGTNIDFAEETDWDLFLTSYYTGPTFRLSLVSYTYNDSIIISPTNNDADGLLDQGETINATVIIKNTGSEMATNVNGTLISSDENITLLVDFCDYGTMANGSQKALDFQFNISQSAPNSQVITLTLIVQSSFANYYVKNDTLYIIINVSTIFGGDSFTNAVEITEGVFNSIMPGLDPYDHSAWFKIKINESKFLLASITNLGLKADFNIYIYDPRGFILTIANLPSYPDSCSTLAPVTGYYRLRIYPYQGSGIFTLNISISNNLGPEDGNAYGTAISFHPDHTTETGSCPNPNSVTGCMYYRVYLEAGEGIRVTLLGDSYEHDFDLYLYDNNLEVITYSWNYRYPELINYVATQMGYVYIVVVPYSGSGTFELQLEYFDPSAPPEWIFWVLMISIILIVSLLIYLRFKKRAKKFSIPFF